MERYNKVYLMLPGRKLATPSISPVNNHKFSLESRSLKGQNTYLSALALESFGEILGSLGRESS